MSFFHEIGRLSRGLPGERAVLAATHSMKSKLGLSDLAAQYVVTIEGIFEVILRKHLNPAVENIGDLLNAWPYLASNMLTD